MIRNIEYSHTIGTIDYDKAELVVPKYKGEEDVIPLRFKKFSNKYEENQNISIIGNIRSYSEKLNNGKNHVHLYVFTYFDLPGVPEDGKELINDLTIDGRICKIDPIRIGSDGKQSIHFILANNIISEQSHQKLNTYLPFVAFGKNAIEISKLNISDKININGRINSRLYKKALENNEIEIRTAYEGIVNMFQKVE